MGASTVVNDGTNETLFGLYEIEVELAKLRRTGTDNERVEVKRCTTKVGTSFWETVSAFANTEGGLILLGLDEPDFTPTKGFDFEKVQDQVTGGLREAPNAEPKVTPVPEYRIATLTIEETEIIAIRIEPLADSLRLRKQMPCFVSSKQIAKGSYKRVLDQDQLLNQYEIFSLSHRFDEDLTDLQPVAEATLEDLSSDRVENLIERLTDLGSRVGDDASSTKEILIRLKVVANGKPTLSGLLVFGGYPQQFFPQFFIDVTTHPGLEKGTGTGGQRFLTRRRCDGGMPLAIDDAVQAVLKELRTRYVESEGTIREEKEVPPIAIREAIANAVMHRDYGEYQRGQQIAVDIYPDRVEITSPGGLWADRTEDNITDGRSVSRNTGLANLLSYVIDADLKQVAENQGSGIPRMLKAMQESGLPRPEFKDKISTFTVTLPRFGLLTHEARQFLDTYGHGKNNFQDIALTLARDLGAVSPQDLRRHVGMDSDDARAELGDLARQRLLRETAPDHFVLRTSDVPTGTSAAILEVLHHDKPLKTQEIAELTDRSPATIRLHLRELVSSGLVIATAPPTSRNRAYRLAHAVA
ncbi:ATP-binding protein [Corynebacterium sanguinis]|nr:ATP-binding protein [Corynebacterium sanguinis]MCT1714416.1 putative DNA binding domain-containing protein [Corynebacterium sanguinis]MCT1805433.1 putative DNA binding domain-containing protein [Corynebacterium sanguinis]